MCMWSMSACIYVVALNTVCVCVSVCVCVLCLHDCIIHNCVMCFVLPSIIYCTGNTILYMCVPMGFSLYMCVPMGFSLTFNGIFPVPECSFSLYLLFNWTVPIF